MARSKKEIAAAMMATLPDTYDKSEGSVTYDLVTPAAVELEKREATDESILANAFFATADEEHKLTIAQERANIERKPATYATGTVKITGTPGAVVAVGDAVASDTLVFSITQTATIPAEGYVNVTARCNTAGTGGNVPVGAIKDFPMTLDGLDSVTNETAFEGGYEQEDMEDLEARYYEKVQDPPTSGNDAHYRQWAKEVAGVGGVKVKARYPSRGSVTCVIIDANKRAASQSLCTACLEHIEEMRPIGADVYVVPATEKTISVSATVTAIGSVTAAIEENLTEWLKEQAFETAYISYAKIGEQILNTEGVIDYENLLVNGAVGNVAIASDEVAVLGGVTIE